MTAKLEINIENGNTYDKEMAKHINKLIEGTDLTNSKEIETLLSSIQKLDKSLISFDLAEKIFQTVNKIVSILDRITDPKNGYCTNIKP